MCNESANKLFKQYVVRIFNTADIFAPAENIKVSTVDSLSAAIMAVEVYEEEITGDYIGEPDFLRQEKYVHTFITDMGYFLEVVECC